MEMNWIRISAKVTLQYLGWLEIICELTFTQMYFLLFSQMEFPFKFTWFEIKFKGIFNVKYL